MHHSGGTTSTRVDQRVNGGRWNALGVFDLAPASGHKVVVDDDGADNTVIADAVCFQRIGDSRRVVADAVRIVPNTAEDALYVHADHLGSPQKMTDATAAVVWNASTTPFGIENVLTGTETNNQRFPGQYKDATSGFHYNYFRHYDPSIGRYVTSDPIGLNGGLNTYAYVRGNPVNAVDPLGLMPPDMFPPRMPPSGQGSRDNSASLPGCPVAEPPTFTPVPPANSGAPLFSPYVGIPPIVLNEKNNDKPPFTGQPGERKNIDRNGKPFQDRVYGPDGFPQTDIDYGHDHGQGEPHAHDWERPAGGGDPTNENRGRGRPPKPGEAR